MRRTHLPIATPCHENWDAMDRVERGRFCHSCDKQVFDLSSMTEREATGVLQEHAGTKICVRYCHDAGGQIRFRPERPARAAMLAVALAACTPHAPDHQTVGELRAQPVEPTARPEPEPEPEMGKVEVVPPEPEMGAIEVVPPEPEPEPDTELMGDVAAPPMVEVKGEAMPVAPPTDEPCDVGGTPTPPAPTTTLSTPHPSAPPKGMQRL